VSPIVTAMIETDFWALHWKSKNFTWPSPSLGVSFPDPSGCRFCFNASNAGSPASISPRRPRCSEPLTTQLADHHLLLRVIVIR